VYGSLAVVVWDWTCAITLMVKVRNSPTASRIRVRMSCPGLIVSSPLLILPSAAWADPLFPPPELMKLSSYAIGISIFNSDAALRLTFDRHPNDDHSSVTFEQEHPRTMFVFPCQD
jgi:hypothetical protein